MKEVNCFKISDFFVATITSFYTLILFLIANMHNQNNNFVFIEYLKDLKVFPFVLFGQFGYQTVKNATFLSQCIICALILVGAFSAVMEYFCLG